MNKYSDHLCTKIAPSQQYDSNYARDQNSGNKFDDDLHFLGLQSR